MTYTEKRLEEFDIRKVLPFTMGYAQRHPHEMESTVADKINAEVNYAIHQAIAEERERVRGEIEKKGEVCGECKGDGWYSGSEAGHGCDGTEEGCARTCPIEIQIQVGCEQCLGKGKIYSQEISDLLSSLDRPLKDKE